MAQPIRISARTLGALAMPDACARCFWLQMNLQGKAPWQIFPGIFNTIDTYGKRLVQNWFSRHGSPPPWLAGLGKIVESIKPPHHSVFKVVDEKTSILLSGTPDAVFLMGDGSHAIIDYKTAKFTAAQDELFPMYEVQLNAYAHIGDRCDFKPVSGLALVYTEPVTTDSTTQDDSKMTDQGFMMGFRAHILEVEIKPALVPKLLQHAKRILDASSPPAGAPGCVDCASLQELFKLSSR